MNPSKKINSTDSFYSLCDICHRENICGNSHWSCLHFNSTPFLQNSLFLEGKKASTNTLKEVDCIYITDSDIAIAIEIKDQPIKNVNFVDITGKIKDLCKVLKSKNEQNRLENNTQISSIYVTLMLSSVKNSHKTTHNLLLSCESAFKANGITVTQREHLRSKDNRFSNFKVKFAVIKCKDMNENFINSLN